MMYTEVDQAGNIVRSMCTDNPEAAMPHGHRLLPDRGHQHLQYEAWQYPTVIQPVRAIAAEIEYEVRPIPENVLADDIRENRNDMLASSDWTQLLDAPLTAQQKTAWASYRKALRDLPLESGFPYEITMPSPPL